MGILVLSPVNGADIQLTAPLSGVFCARLGMEPLPLNAVCRERDGGTVSVGCFQTQCICMYRHAHTQIKIVQLRHETVGNDGHLPWKQRKYQI